MAWTDERRVAFHLHKLGYKHRVLRRRIRPALASALDEWTWRPLGSRKDKTPILSGPK